MSPARIRPSLFPFAVPALLTALLALLGACGGDEGEFRPGQLTDPRNVPTATPWASPPEVIILDPEALTPLPPEGEPGEAEEGEATPGAPGDCGETYTVEAGDSPFSIAEKCDVDPDDLLEANPGLDPRNLRIGQVINIPQ